MRAAYADPPYLGQAKRHYGSGAREVNHELLIAHLMEFDGWALSCSSPSLKSILPLCPEGTRVCAWVKPWASFKPTMRLAYAWEPVLIYGERKRDPGNRTDLSLHDWVKAGITHGRDTHGAKPLAFCLWLFQALGLQPTDDLTDLFPGSGAVSRAWDAFRAQAMLFAT